MAGKFDQMAKTFDRTLDGPGANIMQWADGMELDSLGGAKVCQQ